MQIFFDKLLRVNTIWLSALLRCEPQDSVGHISEPQEAVGHSQEKADLKGWI
jgi:hypothetical protein